MHEEMYDVYHCPDYNGNLNNMRLNSKWCDLTIKVNGKELRVHKVILAANLKYFEVMLSNDSFLESNKGVITMDIVDEDDLESFVTYAYTGEILLTSSNALNFLKLANYLNELGIKRACVEFLEKYMRDDEACEVYDFAVSIGCAQLKAAAISVIVTHFEFCSQTNDYLLLDYDKLVDIFFNGKIQPGQIQQMFFEGMMRWIGFDEQNRKIHIRGLLSRIDITELMADDVLDYLYDHVDYEDEYGVMKVVIYCYRRGYINRKNQIQTLAILGSVRNKSCFQLHNYAEKKWSPLQDATPTKVVFNSYGAILNDELYFIGEKFGRFQVQVFNPATKLSRTLHCPKNISGSAGVCAFGKFLYLCGGHRTACEVLRYNLETDSFKALTSMKTQRFGSAAIFYRGYLFVLGGNYEFTTLNWVEKYNPVTNIWEISPSMIKARRWHAVAVLDGKLYACGGYGGENSSEKLKSVEVYVPGNGWQAVADMNEPRSGFLLVARQGKLLAVGGDNGMTAECYSPSQNHWQLDSDFTSGLEIQHPRGGFIVLGSLADGDEDSM